jgi:predicted metal-dependent hydrolase
MTELMYQLDYGETPIRYTLAYADRKTLAITVAPDCRVRVAAPHGTPLSTIEHWVRKRAAWIVRQQREFECYLPQQPPRQYLSGETHRYLGRQYRLKVIANSPDFVKLTRGYLNVYTTQPGNAAHTKYLVEAWYMQQAQRVLPERVRAMIPRFTHLGVSDPPLVIKPLKARWGSCASTGVITLNSKLMYVPTPAIDYVVIHELAHLVEHNHSRRFYALLDQLMPDWRERKQVLNTFHTA